jgi:hypothetical protein
LLGVVIEGLLQIVRLLSAPCLLVDEVGARVNVLAIIGVALVMR